MQGVYSLTIMQVFQANSYAGCLQSDSHAGLKSDSHARVTD
jgi:hypothetical protein